MNAMPGRLRALALALLMATGGERAARAQTPSVPPPIHRFYVRVFDVAGPLVTDLEPDEMEVREGGELREVTRMRLGGDPQRVLLFVDTSTRALRDLTSVRRGLAAFLDGVPEDDEVALITTGGQVRVRVPPTLDRVALKRAADGLFPEAGGTVMIDAILEAWDHLAAPDDRHEPVIVTLSSDGAEMSSSTGQTLFPVLGQRLVTAGVVVHAVILSDRASVTATPTVLAGTLTQNTGGVLDIVYSASALAGRLRAIVDEIVIAHQKMNSWYQVNYASETPVGGRISVGLTRLGVKLDVSRDRPR